jgi:hypothetical protein
MLLWQWLLVFGVPASAVISGLLLGKFLSSDRKKKIRWWSFPTKQCLNGKPCITFDQFIDMYQINPDKWSVHSDYFNERDTYLAYSKRYDDYYYLFWKTLRDRRRFNRWLKKRKKTKTVNKSNEVLTTVLTDVQKDVQKEIERRQKEFDKEIARINKEKEQRQREYEMLQRYPSVSTANASATVSTTLHDIRNHVATIVTQNANTSAVKLYPDDSHQYYHMGKPVTVFKTADGKTFIENEDGIFEEVINCSLMSVTAAGK